MVCNLYGQHRYGRKGNYTVIPALQRAMEGMMKQIGSWEDEAWIKIGLPYGIGAGLGGGNWNEILAVIENVSDQYEQDIYRIGWIFDVQRFRSRIQVLERGRRIRMKQIGRTDSLHNAAMTSAAIRQHSVLDHESKDLLKQSPGSNGE